MSTAIATTTTTYSIDKAHSEVTFQVRHLLTKVRGRFSDFNGTVEYDEESPERSGFSSSYSMVPVKSEKRPRTFVKRWRTWKVTSE